MGCRNAFDAVYGSSAGAINATYFLSGQRDGVNIYTEEIANQQFIDLRRLFKKDQGDDLSRLYMSCHDSRSSSSSAFTEPVTCHRKSTHVLAFQVVFNFGGVSLVPGKFGLSTSPPMTLILSVSLCAAPALDLGYLLNVMHHKRPLDWEAVLKSDVPLKVVASCLDTLQPIILEDFTSAQVGDTLPITLFRS